jgi:hypothetical protein
MEIRASEEILFTEWRAKRPGFVADGGGNSRDTLHVSFVEAGRVDMPLGSEDFIPQVEEALDRILRRQQPSPNGERGTEERFPTR